MKQHDTAKIAVAVLALLLVSSALAVFSNSTNTTVEAADYGDIMQYDWPILGRDDYNTRFNPGPAPNKPDVLWRSANGAINTVFNGKAFSVRSNRLYAVDAFTGALMWNTALTYGGSSPNKIDDNYLFVDSTRGVAVYRISDGAYVSHLNVTTSTLIGWNNPGGGSYYPGKYSAEMKMKYRVVFDTVSNESSVVAISLADPLNPKIAWQVTTDKTSEVHTTGEGKVFIGSYSGYCMYALNGTTGDFLWRAPKQGICGYTALYYNGAVYHAGGTQCLTAYNASNGNILWNYDMGATHWCPHGIMAAYGRIYCHEINEGVRPGGVPTGNYMCWDAETGELLWKTENNLMGGYWTPAVADGKIYAMTIDSPNWAGENPLTPYTWCAYDAFTGTILWKVIGSAGDFIVAYGNLYAGTVVMGSTSPKSWSYWRGNTDNPGVAVGQHASLPSADTVKWTYRTGGAVTSSPVVVDGKVYIGSYDRNWYCLDANTGSLIWKFPIEFEASSSAAVIGGRMYTGADDGYVYCIDANTGAQIWKTDIYGKNVPDIQFEIDTAQVRSSPIVIGNNLYVGALNNKVYCLSASSGSIQWTYQTNGPIGGSPAYSNGIIYITSTDRNLYALDATKGTVIWKWTTPRYSRTASSRQIFFVGTPTVVEGKVFIGTGGRSLSGPPAYACLNATTGAQLWLAITDPEGASNAPYALTCYNGVLYGEGHMSAMAFNATNGNAIWRQWLGHQVYSSPAYADDPSGGKIYIGCDSYSITCFNATDGKVLSWYTTRGQVYSSPTIYDCKVYVGSADQSVYCFDDTPVEPTSIWANSDKGAQMWSNETMAIRGQLLGTTIGKVWYDLATEVDVDSSLHPGIPNATVILSINKPDLSSLNLTTTTDKQGYFTVSYNPTTAGDWGWVAFYEGQQLQYITYSAAYTEYNQFEVTAPPTSGGTSTPTPTPTPTPAGMPVEYIYAAVAVIAIVLIVAAVLLLRKKTK